MTKLKTQNCDVVQIKDYGQAISRFIKRGIKGSKIFLIIFTALDQIVEEIKNNDNN